MWCRAGLCICLLVAQSAACIGCDESDPSDAASATADAGPGSLACEPARTKPDGACCPSGTFYAYALDDCIAVGPPVCAHTVLDEPSACMPRWCGDWRDDDQKACDARSHGCFLVARPCTEDELAAGGGCPAGTWPDPDLDAACSPVGRGPSLAGPVFAGDAFDGLAALTELPERVVPHWCWNGSDIGCLKDADKCKLEPRGCTRAERDKGAGCPAGAWPDADSVESCSPAGVAWICPPGFVTATRADPTAMLPDCVPDPADCPTDTWGGEHGPNAIYVNVAAKGVGLGSRASPHSDLQAALKAAKAGSVVVLAKGEYTGPANFHLPFTVRGVCAAGVTIHTTGGVSLAATYGAAPTGEARLEQVRLTGGGAGVGVYQGWQMRVRRVFIDRAVHVGALAQHAGSRVHLEDVVISHTRENNGPLPTGQGVQVGGGGQASLRRVRVIGSRYGGLLVAQPGARIGGEQVRVDGTRAASKHEHSGFGVVVGNGGRLDLRGANLHDNRYWGLAGWSSGSVVRLTGVAVGHTRSHIPGVPTGHGLHFYGGATGVVCGAVLEKNRTGGLLATKGAIVRAGGLMIADHVSDKPSEDFDSGLHISGASKVGLHGASIAGNGNAGVMVQDSGSRLVATDVLIDKTLPAKAGAICRGLSVLGGARVNLRRARISRSHGYGVVTSGESSVLEVRDVLIDGTDTDEGFTAGLAIRAQSLVRFAGLRLSQNRMSGIYVNEGGRLSGAGLLTDRCLMASLTEYSPSGSKKYVFAMGLAGVSGAGVQVAGGRSTRNGVWAVSFGGAKTSADLVGLAVDRTLPNPLAGDYGVGLDAWAGATVQASDSMLARNYAANASVRAATLTLRRVVLRDAQAASYLPPNSDKPVELADGVVVGGGSTLVLDASLIFANPRAGVLVDGPAQLTLGGSVMSGNGYGLVLQGGAKASHDDSLLTGNSISNVSSTAVLPVASPPKPVF